MKAIGKPGRGDTLIGLCSSKVRHSLTCLKTWGKGPKRLKRLKTDHFCKLWTLLPANFSRKTK